MPAASLQAAANDCYDTMFIWWNAGQLKLRFVAFTAAVNALFSDAVPNDRTVGDWLVPMQALADQMSSGVTPTTEFNAAAQYVYRICWQGDTMQNAGLISIQQADDLLADYNSYLG